MVPSAQTPLLARDDALQYVNTSMSGSDCVYLASITSRIINDPIIFDRLQLIGQEVALEAQMMSFATESDAVVMIHEEHETATDSSEYASLDLVLGFSESQATINEEPEVPSTQSVSHVQYEIREKRRHFLHDFAAAIRSRSTAVSHSARTLYSTWVGVVSTVMSPIRRLFTQPSNPGSPTEPLLKTDNPSNVVAALPPGVPHAVVAGTLLATLILLKCPPGILTEFTRILTRVLSA